MNYKAIIFDFNGVLLFDADVQSAILARHREGTAALKSR